MDCQASLLTPTKPGGIGTIQITGPQSKNILNEICQDIPKNLPPEKIFYTSIYDDKDLIDQVVISSTPELNGYKIHCHGGPRILQRLLMIIQSKGCDILRWQDHCIPNSLEEEILYYIPKTSTTLGVKAISSQLTDGLGYWSRHAIQAIRSNQYSESKLSDEINTILASQHQARILLSSAKVAIAGPANVGKSTLANQLCGHTQSIIADMEGTTRDWTHRLIDVNGIPVNLIDTAGRRSSDDELEQASIRLSEDILHQSDLILCMMSITEENPMEKIKAMIGNYQNTQIVINKCDLDESLLSNPDFVYISALKDQNLDQLRHIINDKLGFDEFNYKNPLVFTDRQRQILESVISDSSKNRVKLLEKLLDNNTEIQ